MSKWTKRRWQQNEEDLKNPLSPFIDDGGRVIKIQQDPSTHGLVTVTHPVHSVHEGVSFLCGDSTDDLGGEAGDQLQLVFTTADVEERAHFVYAAYGAGAYYLTFMEAPTGGGTGGSAVTIFNRRRDSTNTPVAITSVTKDDSAATGGVLLHEHYVGAGRTDGGESRELNEWILAPNTTYALRVYATANINAWAHINWGEGADKG